MAKETLIQSEKTLADLQLGLLQYCIVPQTSFSYRGSHAPGKGALDPLVERSWVPRSIYRSKYRYKRSGTSKTPREIEI